MVNLFFPDRSQFQGHTTVASHLVVARASEGNWLTDPDYQWNVAHAKTAGILQGAYHFLEDGSSASSQAKWAHAIAGKAPMMLDVEPVAGGAALAARMAEGQAEGQGHYCGQAWADLERVAYVSAPGHGAVEAAAAAHFISRPSIALAAAWIDAYRAAGGICHDVYLPRWYWEVLGRPSLKPLIDRRCFLTSSVYTAYTDSGPGWAGYGGMTPRVWQYTSAGPGSMDWNAYRSTAAAKSVGAATAEVWSLMTGGSITAGHALKLTVVRAGPGESLRQLVAAYAGNGIPGALEHTLAKAAPAQLNSVDFRAYLGAGDWDAALPAGTSIWLWV